MVILTSATATELGICNTLQPHVGAANAGAPPYLPASGALTPGDTGARIQSNGQLWVTDLVQRRCLDAFWNSGINAGDLAAFQTRVTAAKGLFATIYVTFGPGDSLTVGTPGTDGFRLTTDTNLVARGLAKAFAYTGHITGGTAPTNHYQAVGGTTSAVWRTAIRQVNGFRRTVRTTCFRMMIGTNDAAVDHVSAAVYYDRMTALLNVMRSAEPQACISLGRIPPMAAGTQPIGSGLVAGYNAILPSVVAESNRQGQITILEADAGLVLPTDFQADGVHLNATGNAKMTLVASQGIVDACTAAGYLP